MSPWSLDPAVVFLNHGSFGACPAPVLDVQSRLRARLEAEPVRFFVRELEPLLDDTRQVVAALVGAPAEDVAFVPNATFAVNSVLASIDFHAGDEVVVTDHGYGACNNAARRWTERAGAKVVVAPIPFPISDPAQVVTAVLGALGERTRLLLVDHVTSPTGLVLPVEAIVRAAEARGIPVLVDGAHAPGMLALDLEALDPTYYTGNLHKWVCAPKGAGFLYARRSAQAGLHPVVVSHGLSSPRTDRSRYLLEFDWIGTTDPTAILSVPTAIDFVSQLSPDGLEGVVRDNRVLALEARALLAERLGLALPCPDSMIGSLASVPLPSSPGAAPTSSLYGDPLQEALLDRYGIEVPIIPWPCHPHRLVRVSAQRYNRIGDYEKLAVALGELLAEETVSPRP
jgi:isopenicillin-N epimerase